MRIGLGDFWSRLYPRSRQWAMEQTHFPVTLTGCALNGNVSRKNMNQMLSKMHNSGALMQLISHIYFPIFSFINCFQIFISAIVTLFFYRMEKSFIVVRFTEHEEVKLIPEKWIISENTCVWPPLSRAQISWQNLFCQLWNLHLHGKSLTSYNYPVEVNRFA